MNKRKMMGVAAMAVAAMTITTVGGVSVYADDDINATVIWRAFDDQFQSGFRIIMGNEEENIGGIKLDMQDAENQVSVANNKLDMALTKGTDIVAICAPDRESTAEMAQKMMTQKMYQQYSLTCSRWMRQWKNTIISGM